MESASRRREIQAIGNQEWPGRCIWHERRANELYGQIHARRVSQGAHRADIRRGMACQGSVLWRRPDEIWLFESEDRGVGRVDAQGISGAISVPHRLWQSD